MLPHYSALKVAETFNMLNGLYPGRIDLGIGRAPGTSGRVAHLLQRDLRYATQDDFLEQMEELRAWFANERTEVPIRFESPEIWLLGIFRSECHLGRGTGTSDAFADFINPGGAPFAAWYRRQFVPSKTLGAPRQIVAVSAICADTDEEALRLSSSVRMVLLKLFRAGSVAVPTVAKAEEFLRAEGHARGSAAGRAQADYWRPGESEACAGSRGGRYAADEVLIVTITHDHEARCRSYELIAREFALI